MNALVKAMKDQGVQEMRFFFCQKSPQAQGLRTFLTQNFTSMKQQYPQLPLLIREAQGHSPVVIARFPKGAERGVDLTNKKPEEIQAALQSLITSFKPQNV